MKKLPVAAAIMLIAGLWYWQWRHDAEHMALLQQQTAKLQHETSRLQQASAAMQKQATELQASAAAVARQSQAMKQQFDSERAYAVNEKARYLRAADLAQGLQVAYRVRTMVAEYYMENGHWPGSNKTLGLPAPGAFKGKALRSVEIAHDGVLVLTYAGVDGLQAGEIRLTPRYDRKMQDLKWRCETASYPHIAIAMPQCVYVAVRAGGS